MQYTKLKMVFWCAPQASSVFVLKTQTYFDNRGVNYVQ